MLMLQQKLARVQQQIRQQKLKGLLLGNYGWTATDDLLYYLILRTPEYATLFIPDKGKPTLYTIPFEAEESRAELGAAIVVQPLPAAMAEINQIRGARGRVGMRAKTTPVEIFERIKKIHGVKWKNFTGAEEIMSVKLPAEQKYLRQAGAITDKIFKELLSAWKNFKTEEQAAIFIRARTAHYGVESAFPPIIASGKNAANPHHQTSLHKIQRGFCVIDMGVRYGGYCSDMSRTIFVGRPTKKEQALYYHVLSIQNQTIERVRSGANTAEIYRFCRAALGEELNKQFVHGLGHGLGTQVHEWPSVIEQSAVTLKNGMLITIEPGIYLPGRYGIRVEDDVLVRFGKPLVFSQSEKKLILV